jgi:N-methylhydantoinase B
LVEREDPVRVLAYGFVPDSGGPGAHRGGLAIRRVLELLAPRAVLNLRTHRTRTPPFGLAGGGPGTCAATSLLRDGSRTELPGKSTTLLQAGDVIDHRTASGGGHGDPARRDPAATRADVLDGKLAADSARRVYGVDIPDQPPQEDTVR